MNRSPIQMLDTLLEKYSMTATSLCNQVGVSTNTISRIRRGGTISARFAVLMDEKGYPGSEMFKEQSLWQLDQIPQSVRDEIMKNTKPLD